MKNKVKFELKFSDFSWKYYHYLGSLYFIEFRSVIYCMPFLVKIYSYNLCQNFSSINCVFRIALYLVCFLWRSQVVGIDKYNYTSERIISIKFLILYFLYETEQIKATTDIVSTSKLVPNNHSKFFWTDPLSWTLGLLSVWIFFFAH